MWEDPIVAEVHRTREKLAAEYNFDIDAILRGSSEASSCARAAGLCPQRSEPNQRLKLTGAAIPVLRGPRPPRRPRQLRHCKSLYKNRVLRTIMHETQTLSQ